MLGTTIAVNKPIDVKVPFFKILNYEMHTFIDAEHFINLLSAQYEELSDFTNKFSTLPPIDYFSMMYCVIRESYEYAIRISGKLNGLNLSNNIWHLCPLTNINNDNIADCNLSNPSGHSRFLLPVIEGSELVVFFIIKNVVLYYSPATQNDDNYMLGLVKKAIKKHQLDIDDNISCYQYEETEHDNFMINLSFVVVEIINYVVCNTDIPITNDKSIDAFDDTDFEQVYDKIINYLLLRLKCGQ